MLGKYVNPRKTEAFLADFVELGPPGLIARPQFPAVKEHRD
jgi:hypothetical protein